jgi:hypothetical protein
VLCPLFHPLLHSFLQTLGFKVLSALLISNGVASFTFIPAEVFFVGETLKLWEDLINYLII